MKKNIPAHWISLQIQWRQWMLLSSTSNLCIHFICYFKRINQYIYPSNLVYAGSFWFTTYAVPFSSSCTWFTQQEHKCFTSTSFNNKIGLFLNTNNLSDGRKKILVELEWKLAMGSQKSGLTAGQLVENCVLWLMIAFIVKMNKCSFNFREFLNLVLQALSYCVCFF